MNKFRVLQFESYQVTKNYKKLEKIETQKKTSSCLPSSLPVITGTTPSTSRPIYTGGIREGNKIAGECAGTTWKS